MRLVLALLIAPSLAAQERLFDGRTLNGWTGDPGIWSVEDGAIFGSTRGKRLAHNSFLIFERPAADFELTFECRLEGSNNSGVQYRSEVTDEGSFRVRGYQCDIHPNPDYTGMLYGEGLGRGILARRGMRVVFDEDGTVNESTRTGTLAPIDVSKWHTYRITARGDRLRHEVDEELTVDVTDRHGQKRSSGIIALQVHTGRPMKVWFRNLVLRRFEATPQWIWHGAAEDGATCFARRTFELDEPPSDARLVATCDNHFAAFVNGRRVLQSDAWEHPKRADVTDLLRAGTNVLAIRGKNDTGPAALAARLDLSGGETIVTDASWRSAPDAPDGWTDAGFDASGWSEPDILGAVGDPSLVWTDVLRALAAVVRPIPSMPAVPADDLRVADGYRVEKVFDVPRSLGSWVTITTDDQGRLIASDQSSGLYRLAPAKIGDPASHTTAERLDVDIGGAQGLVWAFDSLYAVVNGRGSGLYRLRDTTGDDRFDRVDKLGALDGAGEHGPHAVILSADRKALLVAAGNHTRLPELSGSRLPPGWGEDLLLPRQWDARGHARGILAPGGWICRVAPDGSTWELVGSGFRNQYDIALNDAGELFTSDADMEWDMGMPWYRPTRICHVTSGAEFGWRSGTGKWPAHYPDSLPAVLDIGPGSPTGLVFGHGTRFPEEDRRALYALDWTFGTIWKIRLTNEGASYRGSKHEFVAGKALPLTDAVVGRDGALYFTTGGRGTKSDVYRVIHTGDHLDPVSAGYGVETETIALRRALEEFHGRQDSRAIASAWKHLGHADRFVRYAARLAIEAQPVAAWRERALAESDTESALGALLALARADTATGQPALLEALDQLEGRPLSTRQRTDLLRCYALSFIRQGRPPREVSARLAERLGPRFPSGDEALDTELCRLLVYLGSPVIVPKAVPIIDRAEPADAPPWAELIERNDTYGTPIRRMLADMPRLHGLQLAFLLRNARDGWTPGLRRTYFEFLRRAQQHPGGSSYRGFIDNMRKEALATCSPDEREALADLTGETPSKPPLALRPPEGPPRQWTLDDALLAVDGELTGRDFDAGRNAFHVTSCAACHRFDGEGGDIGPDLTSIGNRFTTRDLLEAILEPSKVISDQYGSSVVHRNDGTTATGRVVERDDAVEVWTSDPNAEPIRISRSNIARIDPSKVSQMPPGLVTALNEDELRDLIAFLLSGGNRNDPMFSQ